MNRPLLVDLALSLGMLSLASCDESTSTRPSAAEDQPSRDASSLALASNSWITRKEPIRPRFSLATATVPNAAGQSIVYAIAGRFTADNRASSVVQAYNVATFTWRTKVPLPIPVYATNGAGVINGKIYISGGVTQAELVRRDLYMYDPATDSWTQKKSMPIKGESGVTGVINGQLYVLTSCLAYSDCNLSTQGGFYRYDPVTDEWAVLGTPSSLHREGMAGVIGGKFYVAGGHTGLLEVYDPVTKMWTIKKAMAAERSLGAGTAVGGKLYVIGGIQHDPDGTETHLRTTSVYDPTTDTWTNKRPMPTARYLIGASPIVLNGQRGIEVVGLTSPGYNQQYTP